MERKTPAAREQEQAEELAAICRDILINARNELYLHLRFMDTALSSLRFLPDGAVKGAGTDGFSFHYQPEFLSGTYMRGRVYMNRLYLHSILHCVFSHMDTRGNRAEEYWNLACDIAVESMIDGMGIKCLHRPLSPVRREFYMRIKEGVKVMNAQSIYRCLQEENLPEGRYLSLAAEFYEDDHSLWEEQGNRSGRPNDRKNRWDAVRQSMETEMETFSKKASEDAGDLLEQLKVENRERYDYREFLRKFTVLKETLQLDVDSFDYIYYDYGMRVYGNMPLIEPLETKETRRIEEFVIAIDTSMSCSGSLVRRFLEQTFEILSESESFFAHVKIHVIQCDDKVQSDRLITSREDLESYMSHMEITGGGGTDFRPVFQYVDSLRDKKELGKIRGLIYFTDGYGLFPVKPPPYDTAFIFMRDDYSDAEVPPWAVKVILDTEMLEGEADGNGRGGLRKNTI